MHYIIKFVETGETIYKLSEQEELNCNIEELNRRGIYKYQIHKNKIPYIEFLKQINGMHMSPISLEVYFANSDVYLDKE